MNNTPETDMSERPTPRTASAMMELPGRWNSVWVVPAEIACDLESELNDAISERDEAREALRSVIELSEDIPDETLDAWKVEFHTVLEGAK